MRFSRLFFRFMKALRNWLNPRQITLEDELYSRMFCHNKSKDLGAQLFYDAEIK